MAYRAESTSPARRVTSSRSSKQGNRTGAARDTLSLRRVVLFAAEEWVALRLGGGHFGEDVGGGLRGVFRLRNGPADD